MLLRLVLGLSLLVLALNMAAAGAARLVGHKLPPTQRIAYVAAGSTARYSVNLIDVNRRLAVPFAQYPTRVSPPVWSPDGQSLLYRVYSSFTNTLVIANLHTREEIHLDNATTHVSQPAWSPDGGRVAFIANWGGPDFFLYTHDLTHGRVDQLSQGTVYDHTPAWTPDGSQILFVARRRADGISVVGSQGGDERRLAENLTFMHEGYWSPDRARFVYPILETITARPYVILYMLEFSDGPERALPQLLVDGSYNGYDINWAPDGQHIAFVSTRHGNREIYMMHVQDRASIRRLTFDPAEDRRPVWSPDGAQIAFYSDRDGGGLYTVDIATGRVRRLVVANGLASTGFAWQPVQ